MKKAGYGIITFLEAALLIGAYVVNYFTRRKMGMARYVIYKNQGWEREYPMQVMKYAGIALAVLFTILILFCFLKKRRQLGKWVWVMTIAMLVLTAVYVGYTCISSTETMRAYYFISGMFALAAFLQMIKTGAALLMCGKKKNEA